MVSPELLIDCFASSSKSSSHATNDAGGSMRANLLDIVSEGLSEQGKCVLSDLN